MRGRPEAGGSGARFLQRILLACAWLALLPNPACRAAVVKGALAGTVARPTGTELSEVYSWLGGLALDVRICHSEQVSLCIQVSPAFGSGTPRTGSLAEDASANLLMLPGHVLVEYSPGRGSIRPYFGVGAGAVYVKENQSFQSPLGERSSSVSATRLSFDVLAGVEKAARTTPFAELHYQHAGLSGVEDQDGSGVSLSTFQLRLGVRTRL